MLNVNYRKDRQVHFVKTAKSSLKSAQYDRFNKTVLVVRRIISKQGMVAGIEVDIRSAALKELLLEIFEGVEGLKLNKSPPMVCKYPSRYRSLENLLLSLLLGKPGAAISCGTSFIGAYDRRGKERDAK